MYMSCVSSTGFNSAANVPIAVLHRSPGSKRFSLCWELDSHSRKSIQYFWSVRVSAVSVRSAAAVGGWHAGTQEAIAVSTIFL